MFQSMFYQASNENNVRKKKPQNSNYLKNTLGMMKKKLGYLGSA